MPSFVYIARSRTGARVQGALEAADRRLALLQLERQGFVPITVEEKGVAESKKPALDWRSFLRWRRRREKMSSREMLIFTVELSDLLASGMKLGNALNTLSHRRADQAADAVIRTLRDEIMQGTSLSQACAQFPGTFPTLYISLIRAGEAAGNLAEIMQRIVKHYEQLQEVKEKIIMALVYPGIVLTVGLATVIFSMVFVIPRFSIIFKELGSTLPLPTQILIGLSSALLRYGWFFIILLVILIVFFKRYLKTAAGRTLWDGLHLKMPLVRDIVMASAFSQFARTLGMLIGNGVPVLEALSIGEKTVSNSVIAAEIRNARDRVTDGTSISGPLAAGKVFPRMLTDMLAIGEETGDMSGALSHIARRYENNLDRSIKIFTTILEPVLIVLMALIVGFVAISILLAVFEVTNGLNA